MSEKQNQTSENPERKLTAVITFMRHGQKDQDGNLTHQGKIQARKRGVALKGLGGNIILLHSGVGRVKESIRDAARYLNLTDYKEEELEEGCSQQDARILAARRPDS